MSFRVNATFSGMHPGSSSLTPHKRAFAMTLRISRLIFDPSGPRILHGMSLCQGNIHECASRVCANTHVLVLMLMLMRMRINHVTSRMLSFPFSIGKMGRVDQEILRVKRFGTRKTRPYTQNKAAQTNDVSQIKG